MATAEAKIMAIEAEMARTQKNKATASHLGLLKARIAKLRREILDPPSAKAGAGKAEGFDVTKVGVARVGMVGFPSVGKSTLLNKLTGTFSEVAAYEFTTLTCIPGVIRYNGANIQLLDLPGIIEGAKDGKGRGRQVIGTSRTCNLILIVLDAVKPLSHKKLIEHELDGYGIRLNKAPPNISIKKKDKGGITFSTSVENSYAVDLDIVKSIMTEYKIHNADVRFNGDYTEDELIDVLEGSRIYIPAIYVANKMDEITMEELSLLDSMPNYCPVSAGKEWNLDGLLEMVWDRLDLIRVYTKPKGQLPDYNDPVTLPRNSTLEMFCNRIHKHFVKSFKYGMIWGSSAKHKPQRVGLPHILEDEDVVQIVKK
mmetsp:Transcript_4186/g.14586  ORF Transcript_4186/g.14586 Transcript_4186/m.14586 type:complete len:369 (-) Transcript_4186:22-1128(-)|eukprot:CAMPEP_0170142814 /NCGR_PEP_ID=MMETSP0033_2-20121228/8630_1 /TAXON_ID=195969 /ORGANISM="Dolichomastix tenuilepis, Strain CCMP3274" /LENGTH=368 /DNA_ID=CAMNT_0010379191 /DNA_START=87 /DNA_END=1193 /DNA_ORIENTATION=+